MILTPAVRGLWYNAHKGRKRTKHKNDMMMRDIEMQNERARQAAASSVQHKLPPSKIAQRAERGVPVRSERDFATRALLRRVIVGGGVVLSAAIAVQAADIAALAREDLRHEVRPGGVEGRPFWNNFSRMFMYPPAFDFSPGNTNTVAYRFFVHDSAGHRLTFDAPSQHSSLAPVWEEVAPGFTWVWVRAVDAKGNVHGIPDWPRDRFSRYFWKSAPFKPGSYPPKPRPYAEAAAKCAEQIFGRKAIRHFLEHGRPDPAYGLNGYPSKIHAALVKAMVAYAASCPAKKNEALKLARIAADYLVSISEPAGRPLAHFPPTYCRLTAEGAYYGAGEGRAGQVMMMYPAGVGEAYLRLYEAVGDAKYLAAARRIGETYLRTQEADGVWPALVFAKDGRPVCENRLQPIPVITFLESLFAATGEGKFRTAADKAFGWVEGRPLKDWFWEGQFEDAPFSGKYENPSKHMACDVLLYVLRRFPGDRRWREVARDILRYSEDQFVCWEKPCQPNGMGINSSVAGPLDPNNDYDHWFFPCALEQYIYYVPIDASLAKMIRAYLALYRAEGSPLDLAKARALGDSLVRLQRPNGYIPTEPFIEWKNKGPDGGWLNCTCATVAALSELGEIDNVKEGK